MGLKNPDHFCPLSVTVLKFIASLHTKDIDFILDSLVIVLVNGSLLFSVYRFFLNR